MSSNLEPAILLAMIITRKSNHGFPFFPIWVWGTTWQPKRHFNFWYIMRNPCLWVTSWWKQPHYLKFHVWAMLFKEKCLIWPTWENAPGPVKSSNESLVAKGITVFPVKPWTWENFWYVHCFASNQMQDESQTHTWISHNFTWDNELAFSSTRSLQFYRFQIL